MKVTIDTKEDSHEDIKKVLHILTNILQNKDDNYQIDQKSEKNLDTTSMMSMFDSSQKQQSPAAETQGKAPDFTSFLNLQNSGNREDNDDMPKIEYF